MTAIRRFLSLFLIFCLLSGASCPAVEAEEAPAGPPAPSPVISRRVPAYAGVNGWSARSGNDDHYSGYWTGKMPDDYLAYDLSGVPEAQRQQVMAVWYNPSTFDQLGDWASRTHEPTDYTIEVNAAPGGAFPEEGWVTVVTVTDNVHNARAHALDLTGYNWIRLHVTRADGSAAGTCEVNFDVHDVSAGSPDSWLFLGDSITAGGMHNCYGTAFAAFVNRLDSRYFPLQINGGIGGFTSRDALRHIHRWLAVFPGRYVVIAYGTNDAWGNLGPDRYYQNTLVLITAVLEAGKIPVLPTIPYATEPGVNRRLADYNRQVERIWAEFPQVVHGPDFAAIFQEHPEYLGPDGFHPSNHGYENMRRIWAETMVERVYHAGSPD